MKNKKINREITLSDNSDELKLGDFVKSDTLITVGSPKSKDAISILDTISDKPTASNRKYFLMNSVSNLPSPKFDAKSPSFISRYNSRDASLTKDTSLGSTKVEYKRQVRNRQSLPVISKSLMSPLQRNSPSTSQFLTFLNDTVDDQPHKLKKIRKMHKNAKPVVKVYSNLMEQTLSLDNFYNNKGIIIENCITLAKNLCAGLENMQKMINAASTNRKDKDMVEKYMNMLVANSQKAKNIELYFYSLKLQGKILLLFSDIFRAIQTFRYMKKLADRNSSYINKLKSYKYLGKCYQSVGNHQLAIFYFVKLLQTAWLCDSDSQELVAYDLIGVQYYYLGELEKSEYYHNKMMDGKIEPKDSEIRKVGISKLLYKINEDPTLKKRKIVTKIKSIEEELTSSSPPSSEDEFELPSHASIKEDEYRQKESAMIRGLNYGDKQERKYIKAAQMDQARLLRQKMQSDPEFRAKQKRKPMFVKDQGFSEVYLLKMRKETILNPPKKQVLLSHLSPNRFLNNFHVKDPRYIINAFMLDEPTTDGLVLLDAKSLNKMKAKFKGYYETLEDTISFLENFVENLMKHRTQQWRPDMKRRLSRIEDTI